MAITQTIPKDGIGSRHYPYAALSEMHGYKRVDKDKARVFLSSGSSNKITASADSPDAGRSGIPNSLSLSSPD